MNGVVAVKDKKMRLSVLAGMAVGILACLLFVTLPAHAQSVTFTSARDCNANAVINCGALSVSELQQKFQAQQDVQALYATFNISPTDITNMSNDGTNCTTATTTNTAGSATSLCAGTVTKAGTVIVNGRTVATNALTAGRQNMPGSTAVTAGGTTFYTRPPSVSFVSDNLDAFVLMNNGQFQSAVLASCGNPVKATAVAQPKPQPTPQQTQPAPTPPKPQPAPQQQQQQQQQQTVVVQPAVVQQSQPQQQTTAAAPAPQSLPNTGPGAIAGLFAGTSTLGAVAARFYLRRRSI